MWNSNYTPVVIAILDDLQIEKGDCYRVTYLPVDREGLADLEAAITGERRPSLHFFGLVLQ